VSFQAQADTLTYEPYFGLNEKPFSLNADPRFIYDSPTYVATSERLLAGLRRREGLLVLTGEIGTGKTTLCRAVLRDLGRHTYSSLVPDPFASREDLLKMLLVDFGALSIQELTAGPLRQASRTELGYLLSAFLDSLAPDAYVIVIIDEAQNLSLPLIEETRILSDTFGANGRLQIVFVGQPELHAKLKLPEMRQVDQRVCGYHRLAPMSREAVAGYIQHRLWVAGGRSERVLFPPEIVDGLHQRSGGVPRLINRVCDRALQLAYERKAEGVDREILDTALIEVGADTLSPTWDSIIFAEPPTPTPSPTSTPAPAARAVEMTPPIDNEEHFKKQVDHWVSQDLAPPPPPRTLTPLAPAPERRPASKTVPRTTPRREAPARTVTTDWPRDLRSETYMHRLWRIWSKRAAIALAVLVAVNAAVVGASLLPGMLGQLTLPALPEVPAVVAPVVAPPVVAPPAAPLPDAPAPVSAAPSAAPTVSDAGDYLVAVGLFASRDRADQLVDALTQAGLPAMQRPFQLRRQQVQQIVLGPFFSRSDAAADLRRLQQLGGYDDAIVIDSRRDPSAQ
jgi:type II secretory pathway predicted ATPase ExeA